MAASDPFGSPVADCSGPADTWISVLSVHPMLLPIIRRKHSPTPIGLTPGFLLSGINRHEIRASRERGSSISVASLRDNLAISTRSSLFYFLYLTLVSMWHRC